MVKWVLDFGLVKFRSGLVGFPSYWTTGPALKKVNVEPWCLARMVNDMERYTKPNCKMVKVVDDSHQPRLCLYATEMISRDTELRYNYGVADVPWRKWMVGNILF